MTRQASLNRTPHPAHRIYYPIECTVVAVHFPQDITNISKLEIEYDVQPTITGLGRINNVPLAIGVHGIEDDDETLLRPAQCIIPSGSLIASRVGDNTDGDKVIVNFINGSWTSPRITSVLSHPSRGRRDGEMVPRYKNQLEIITPGPANGESYAFGDGSDGSSAVDLKPVIGDRFRHNVMNGTHVAVDRNGDVFINFKANPDPSKNLPAGSVAKKFVMQNEGQDLVRIEKKSDGSIAITLAENFASNILFKIAGGAQSAAIAEKLESLYTSLKGKLDAFDAHTHTTGTGPSGPPTPTIGAPGWDSDINSTKIKIPGN